MLLTRGPGHVLVLKLPLLPGAPEAWMEFSPSFLDLSPAWELGFFPECWEISGSLAHPEQLSKVLLFYRAWPQAGRQAGSVERGKENSLLHSTTAVRLCCIQSICPGCEEVKTV